MPEWTVAMDLGAHSSLLLKYTYIKRRDLPFTTCFVSNLCFNCRWLRYVAYMPRQ